VTEARTLRTISIGLGAATAGLGFAALIGWSFRIEVLFKGAPGWIAILPWTALLFAAGGMSLVLQQVRPNWRVGAWLGAFVLVAGTAMTVQRLGGMDWPINRMLFPTYVSEHPYRPVGLMATNSAIAMLLLGIALTAFGNRRYRHVREIAGALALLIGFFAVLGYVYDVSRLYRLDLYAAMAQFTTTCFVLLSTSVLIAKPERGLASLLTGKSSSAVFTRRLLIASVVFPVVLGRLWLAARRSGLVSREIGVALFVISVVVVFLAIVFWSAYALRHSESIREAARTEAERANRAKSEFLAIMSHELRTPLNAIRGYADLLEMGIGGALSSEQKQHVTRIKRSERHLLTLIDDLLTYTQIESGRIRYDIRKIPLKSVVEEAFLLTEPKINAKRIELSAKLDGVEDDFIHADPDKVLQILLNLISNAVKFTEPGGRIALACSCDPSRDDALLMEVRDWGRGIPGDKIDLIFEPFFQIEAGLTRNSDGVGLGLAVSRTLARAMNGDVTASSTPGAGSVFVVRLPRAS
jgi:signal transduction histidine kinase